MDKIWAKDVKEGERVKSLFLVSRKAIPTSKSGKTYLSVTLQDKTGELEARAFERIEEIAAAIEEKAYVEVEGPVGTFQGKPQLRLETAARSDPTSLDPGDFVWVPPPEPKKPEKPVSTEAEDALWRELAGLVGAVADPHVRGLIQAFLEDDDVAARLRRAPAAKTVHHAYAGGLLEHTVSCLKLAHRVADHYPQIDRDLLVAGAFFHDLGKIRELTFERQTEYTDEGRLVGHLVMTAQWIHDKARRVGVPRDLEHHIVHLVLAHHGRMEFGSPKPPMTLEALITHLIDELDSRVNAWLNLMGREGGTRRWTDSNNIHEHHIWRGTLPTLQAEKPGPAAEVLTPVIYVPREVPAAQRRDVAQGPKRKPKPERRAEPPHREAPRPPEGAAGEAPAPEAPKAEAQPRVERPERPHRPERPDRPDRGGHRGPGGPGGPGGDRKRGYMGPRLPGDRGPQARPAKASALTHNPFAALAQKLEGSDKPAEAAAEPEATPGAAAEPEAAPAPAAAAEREAAPVETPAGEPGAPPPAPETGGESPPGGAQG